MLSDPIILTCDKCGSTKSEENPLYRMGDYPAMILLCVPCLDQYARDAGAASDRAHKSYTTRFIQNTLKGKSE